jgi:putative ubiquitin-RnfH superfamily antitoxin RatB of RatAB toxin-antitoxin module
MRQTEWLDVEVVYALSERQVLLTVRVADGATIVDVIQSSGILTHFPEIDLTQQKVGIFGKLREHTDVVSAGDRVEIYRPLTIDPKEARRAKAKKRK